MANLIANELGVKVELVPVNSANRIPYLQTKKVDLVISSLGKNPEREKVIDFSKAYAPFFQGVFGLKDAKIEKPEDLAGKTVGATRGAIEEQEISKLAPPTATIKRYEDNNATIAAFLSGQVDIIATGNVVAAAIAEKSPGRAPDLQVRDQGQPLLHRPQQGRAEAAGQDQRDHRQGQGLRRAQQDLGEMAEGTAAGRHLIRIRCHPRACPESHRSRRSERSMDGRDKPDHDSGGSHGQATSRCASR